MNVKIENLKENYGIRGLVSLELTAANMGRPTVGSFSVAVTNATAVEADLLKETNIFTSLLLTSELKGYVEDPNYYFLSDDEKTRKALDNLLLTQGWRKIDWQAVNSSKFPVNSYQEETELKISGTVTTNSGKPVPNGKVTLLSTSTAIFAIDTLTDANGKFNFNELEFPDSTKFAIQAQNEKGVRQVLIRLDVNPRQLITTNKNNGDIEINVNEQLKRYLQNSDDYFEEMTKRGILSKTIHLKKVEIVGTKKTVHYSHNLNGPGNADAVFTSEELGRSVSLTAALGGRIPGIKIFDGKAFARQFGKDSLTAMAIILDGIYMGDIPLNDININHIETVEVLKTIGNTAIYGMHGIAGVLVITSKQGGISSSTNPYAPGIITYSPKGYATNRQFYSPKYEANPDPKPDLRTTVYWNPSIVSDQKGKFKFEYYNTDEPGLYRVVIEGMDLMGNIARKTFTYQVN